MGKMCFSALFSVWWRFFWRSALLGIVLLLMGGCLLSLLKEVFYFPRILFIVAILYNLLIISGTSLLVFYYIIGRKFKKSPWILQLTREQSKRKIWGIWLFYFTRFVLFAFAIAFMGGALLPVVVQWCGYNSAEALKYSKFLGNISVIPASFSSFLLLIWHYKKKNKLIIQSIDLKK